MKTAKYLLCILFMSGCHSSTLKSKQLKVNFPDDPPTLDPRKGGDAISSTVQFMLFEELTRMTKESSTQPALAEKIDISGQLLNPLKGVSLQFRVDRLSLVRGYVRSEYIGTLGCFTSSRLCGKTG